MLARCISNWPNVAITMLNGPNGVASANTITGNGALKFMQAVANEHNHILMGNDINKICCAS